MRCSRLAVAASPVPWNSPAGSTTFFDYSNGQYANGYFTDPLVLDTGFVFFTSNFVASSQNGNSDSKTDTISFDVTVKNNQAVTGIVINELGDYSILGTGTVNIGGSLQITNLAAFEAPTVEPLLVVVPGSMITTTTNATGQWTGGTNRNQSAQWLDKIQRQLKQYSRCNFHSGRHCHS